MVMVRGLLILLVCSNSYVEIMWTIVLDTGILLLLPTDLYKKLGGSQLVEYWKGNYVYRVQYKRSRCLFFFLAGTIFFEASPNRNKNRQMSNKERNDF